MATCGARMVNVRPYTAYTSTRPVFGGRRSEVQEAASVEYTHDEFLVSEFSHPSLRKTRCAGETNLPTVLPVLAWAATSPSHTPPIPKVDTRHCVHRKAVHLEVCSVSSSPEVPVDQAHKPPSLAPNWGDGAKSSTPPEPLSSPPLSSRGRATPRRAAGKKKVCWQMPEAEIIAVTPTASLSLCSGMHGASFRCEADIFAAAARTAAAPTPSEVDVLAMALEPSGNECEEESLDDPIPTPVDHWMPEHEDSGDMENNQNLGNLRVELDGRVSDVEKEAADLSRTVRFPRRPKVNVPQRQWHDRPLR